MECDDDVIRSVAKRNGITIDGVFNLPDISHLPDYSGTYIVTMIDDKRYIGSTHNLSSRFTWHKLLPLKVDTGKISRIVFYSTANYVDLERLLIMLFHPELNTHHVRKVSRSLL